MPEIDQNHALEAARTSLGLNASDFARLVGFTPRSVSRWRRGSVPREGSIEQIVRRVTARNAAIGRTLARAIAVEPPVDTATKAPRLPPTAAHVAAEVLIAAEVMDVAPRIIRGVLARILTAADAAGWTIADLRTALAALARGVERESAPTSPAPPAPPAPRKRAR